MFGFNFYYFSIGRTILTKQPFVFDPNGDQDRQDLTSAYKFSEYSQLERLSLYNAVRGTELAKKYPVKPKTEKQLSDIMF